ncbi:hypothetical protein BGZ91_001063, partial [Linnemannia elongata]
RHQRRAGFHDHGQADQGSHGSCHRQPCWRQQEHQGRIWTAIASTVWRWMLL